jgi:hypothetical protein
MKRTAKLALALVVPAAMAGTVLTAPAAYADDRICRGTIGAQHLDDNVIVPKGATCTLVGTRIDGNVFVRGDATLFAKGRIDVAMARRDSRPTTACSPPPSKTASAV